MVKRKVIKIDESKCNGCGLCIPNCPEGALQIIDGKARLISDLFCDGLGACIGHCPEGAIKIEEREAEPYDERKVMENIIKGEINVIKAHIEHLKEHNEAEYLKEALAILKEKGIDLPMEDKSKEFNSPKACGCPGEKIMDFGKKEAQGMESELRQWPVQLHLVSPNASYFKQKDVVLAADCVAYALPNFHNDYLKGKSLAIACPKLDDGLEVYLEKLVALIDQAKINTLTVMVMQVPCCGGLVHLAKKALSSASRKIPIKVIVVGIKGEIIKEDWI
jgi:ferredoxin